MQVHPTISQPHRILLVAPRLNLPASVLNSHGRAHVRVDMLGSRLLSLYIKEPRKMPVWLARGTGLFIDTGRLPAMNS